MDKTIWTQIPYPGDLAKAVQGADGFKTRFGRLATHPYNEENPDNSFWWLFPTGKGFQNWPAYRCGKFVFYRPRGSNAIRAGLHIEKGVCKELAEAFGSTRGRHFEMTKAWIWHLLLQDLKNGAMATALGDIQTRSGMAPEFTISVCAPLDEHTLTEKATEYRFRTVANEGLFHFCTKPGEREITGIEQVTSLSTLACTLEAMGKGPGTMLWVDLIIGLDIPISADGPGPNWSGTEVWEGVLEPFSPWIRTEC
ncbi:hypothetical protein KP003_03050 [Geomonas nitrogeniifigens]|uniref:hypothetical protein n=1 Tax=Geomonas diazotrophica TaxID=2843197 RepID=UPI001C2BC3FC|nr:hypothetical protein [Geomonas nitrogeniifigens]QXE87401.1 hypothetical protein KP003_03050 [Geomonas nitrogeniifigens]